MICCFCGNEIDPDFKVKVLLELSDADSSAPDKPYQALFAHDYCLEERLHPSVPFLAEGLVS